MAHRIASSMTSPTEGAKSKGKAYQARVIPETKDETSAFITKGNELRKARGPQNPLPQGESCLHLSSTQNPAS